MRCCWPRCRCRAVGAFDLGVCSFLLCARHAEQLTDAVLALALFDGAQAPRNTTRNIPRNKRVAVAH